MPQLSTLDAIGLRHGTDKASSGHDYLNFYEFFFSSLRNEPLTVLEVGVFGGASLKTWEEYFPNAKIVGADIMPSAKLFEEGRISIELLDQSNIEELTRVAIKHGPFDIIIEDGSHMWEHQLTSLRTLFPFLKSNGLYVVEDLQTNYGSLEERFRGVASSTCVDYLKSWLDLRVADAQIPIDKVEDAFLRTYGREVQFLTFYRRACLIKKHFRPVVRQKDAGKPLVSGHQGASPGAVRLLAHLSHQGDIFGGSGFINPASDRFHFQGLTIETKDGLLEYRVRTRGEAWSDWSKSNHFVGSRGQSKPLTAFTIRLRQDVKDKYALRAFGRFAGSLVPVEVADEQDCTSLSGEPLCGIQIELTERV